MPTMSRFNAMSSLPLALFRKLAGLCTFLNSSGKKLRIAPNRIDSNVRRYPCPTEKQAVIVEVLRKLEDVRLRRSSL
jgi:hypothetical protein